MSDRTGLTEAQRKALHRMAKRDWPAGEPRLRWLHKLTARKLLASGLIVERLGSEERAGFFRSPIVDLTPAGRAALAQTRGRDGSRNEDN